MRLPSFGTEIVKSHWVVSEDGSRIDIEQEVIRYSLLGLIRSTEFIRGSIERDEIEDMAKSLNLDQRLASTKPQPKFLKKRGWCGCKLTPENTIVLGNGTRRCRNHYLEYHRAYNAKKQAERRAAKGGQQ